MKKFHPMALLLKFEGYPPAVIASVAMHACFFLFILGKSVDSSDYVTVEDPVIITASAIDVNPQRLRRLERLEQERVADLQRRQQAQRDERRGRNVKELRLQQGRKGKQGKSGKGCKPWSRNKDSKEKETKPEDKRKSLVSVPLKKMPAEENRNVWLSNRPNVRPQQEQRRKLRQIRLPVKTCIVAEYAGIIKRIISQNWQIPPSARNGMMTEVRLQLVPTGEVVAVNIIQSSGNDVFDRSVLQAVERADRFIELQDLDNTVFERNFRTFTLVFRPEDLLR